MQTEFETKILNINVDEIENKLIELNAEKIEDVLMKRRVFDIESNNEERIRLREKIQGDKSKTTITYKLRGGNEIGSTNEIEVKVDDFDKAAELLLKLKRKGQYYQENKRKTYVYDGIEFSIDTWPKIPTYLEIESDSIEKVKKGLELIGLEGKDNGDLGVLKVYEIYGIDLHSIKVLKF